MLFKFCIEKGNIKY